MTTARKLLIPALLTIGCIAMPALAQDKGKPAAMDKPKAAAEKKVPEGTTKVILDNDKVRVSEVHFKPGQGLPMGERGARVVRALAAGTMERTYPDGKKEKITWKAGEVRYSSKETFSNVNVGKTETIFFITTLK